MAKTGKDDDQSNPPSQESANAKTSAAPAAFYLVLSRLKHNGKLYGVDDKVQLTEAEANALPGVVKKIATQTAPAA